MFRRNYTNHIVTSIIICVAIPAIILFGIMQLDQKAFIKYHVSQVATEQLQNKMSDIQGWLSDKSSSVDQYGSAMESYIKGNGFDDRIPEFLTELAKASRDITYLYLTSEDGDQYVSGEVSPSIDGRTRSWYVGAIKHDLYISEPYEDVLTHEFVITFSKVIRDEKNETQGVIAMDVLLDDVVSDLENAVNGSRFNVIFQNEDGSFPYVSDALNGASFTEMFKEPPNLLELKIKNTKYSGVKYALDNMDSSVYLFLNMDTYYESYSHFNQEYAINALLILGSLFILIRLSSSILYRPLNRLGAYISSESLNEGLLSPQSLPSDLMRIQSKFIKLQSTSDDRKQEIIQMNNYIHEHNKEIETVNTQLETSYSDLRTMKKELEYQEGKYFDLVNNIPDTIWICDANGHMIYGNKPFETLIGQKVEMSEKLEISNFIKGISSVDDKLGVLFGRDYNNIEIDFLDALGNEHSMEGSISRIYESGKLIAVQGVFRDVSDSRSKYFDYYDRNRELTLVNDITKSLISNTELDIVLNDIANKVGQIMSVSMCTIRLLDNSQFKLVASAGSKEQIIYDNSPTLETSHMGLSFKQNKSMIVSGAQDFVLKDKNLRESMSFLNSVVYIPLATNDKVYGIMSIGTEFEVRKEKIKILETLADQAAIAIERMQIFEKLKNHYFKTIEALVAANDAKVPKMEGHTKRVSDIAVEVGKRMYLRKKDIDDIYIAGLLHDIGKMNISDALLSKEKDLSEEEVKILDYHPQYARKILEPIGMSDGITEGIYYHHKKFDLSGEPRNEKIISLPLIARIIGAVDDLDAMLVGRDGNGSLSLSDAMGRIEEGSGTAYCPEVSRVIIEIAQNEPELIEGHFNTVLIDKEASI